MSHFFKFQNPKHNFQKRCELSESNLSIHPHSISQGNILNNSFYFNRQEKDFPGYKEGNAFINGFRNYVSDINLNNFPTNIRKFNGIDSEMDKQKQIEFVEYIAFECFKDHLNDYFYNEKYLEIRPNLYNTNEIEKFCFFLDRLLEKYTKLDSESIQKLFKLLNLEFRTNYHNKTDFILFFKSTVNYNLNPNKKFEHFFDFILIIVKFSTEYKNETNQFNFFYSIISQLIEFFEKICQKITNSLLQYCIEFSNVLLKISDGYISSNLFLKQFNNDHILSDSNHLIMKINNVLLALSYYNYSLLNLRKNENEYFYNENSLPKITLINFCGFDHLLNCNINKNTKNLQYISIVFIYESDIYNEFKNSSLENENKNIFIIPIKLSKDFYNCVNSESINYIFEEIIYNLIRNFNPSYIIFSHNMTFYNFKNIDSEINLNVKKLNEIFQKLSILCSYKIIFIPIFHLNLFNENNDFQPIKFNLDRNYDFFFENYVNNIISFKNWKNDFYINPKIFFNNKLYYFEVFGEFLLTTQGSDKNKEKKKKLNKINKESTDIKNQILQIKENIKSKYLKSDKDNCKYESNLLLLKNQIFNNVYSNKARNNTNDTDLDYENELLENNLTTKNKDYLFTNRLTILTKHFNYKTYELEIKDNNESNKPFYYSKKATYYVCYDIKKIFFFNMTTKEINKNYMFNFPNNSDNSNKLYGNEIAPFPFTQKLIDFTLVYEENTAFYFIWGRKISIQSQSTDDINNNSVMNEGIFCYKLYKNEWNYLICKTDLSPTPRLNAAGCCFKKNYETKIYLFGGYAQHPNKHIYNVIDQIKIIHNSNDYIWTQIDKKYYKNSYFPLCNSQAFSISSDNEKDRFILMGGNYSEFIMDQSNTNPIFYEIIYYFNDNSITVKNKQNNYNSSCEFRNLINNDNVLNNLKGLNLLIASPNKNYIINQIDKKIDIFMNCSFIDYDPNGIFLESKKNYNKNTNFQSQSDINIEKNISILMKKKTNNYSQKFLKSYIFQISIEFEATSTFNIVKLIKISDKGVNCYDLLNKKILFFNNNKINNINIFNFLSRPELIRPLYNDLTQELLFIKINSFNRPNNSKLNFSNKDFSHVALYSTDTTTYLTHCIDTQIKLKNHLLIESIKSNQIIENNNLFLDAKKIYINDDNNVEKPGIYVDELNKSDFRIFIIGGLSLNHIKNLDLLNFYYENINNKKQNFISNIIPMKIPIIFDYEEYIIVFNEKVIHNYECIFDYNKNRIEEKLPFKRVNMIYGEIISKKQIIDYYENNQKTDPPKWISFFYELKKKFFIYKPNDKKNFIVLNNNGHEEQYLQLFDCLPCYKGRMLGHKNKNLKEFALLLIDKLIDKNNKIKVILRIDLKLLIELLFKNQKNQKEIFKMFKSENYIENMENLCIIEEITNSNNNSEIKTDNENIQNDDSKIKIKICKLDGEIIEKSFSYLKSTVVNNEMQIEENFKNTIIEEENETISTKIETTLN